MKKKFYVLFFILLSCAVIGWYLFKPAAFQKPNLFIKQNDSVPYEEWFSDYDELIREVVRNSDASGELQSLLHYTKIKENDAYVAADKKLSKVFLPKDANNDLLLSAWINFYNFLVIKFIVENPHIDSMSALSKGMHSVWDLKAGEINGVACSLSLIEHEIIRKEFSEPRVHFALNCGALSCPNLLDKAYDGRALDTQLEAQQKQFLFNKNKGMKIDLIAKKIYLSQIFKWFAVDFQPNPLKWLEDKGYISAEESAFQLDYLDYNWNLNKY